MKNSGVFRDFLLIAIIDSLMIRCYSFVVDSFFLLFSSSVLFW